MEKIVSSVFALFESQINEFIDIYKKERLMREINIEKKAQLKRLIINLGLDAFREKYLNDKEND